MSGDKSKTSSRLTSRMNDDFFWELVELIGWGTEWQLKIPSAKVMLLKSLSFTELKEFGDLCQKKIAMVGRRTIDYQKSSGERLFDHFGDSFDDFCSEIVGRGRKSFDAFMGDEGEVRAAYDRRWGESFSYCIPAPTDTKLLSGEYYTGQADRYLASLEEQYNEEKANEKNWSPQKRVAIPEGGEPRHLIGIVMDAMTFVRNYQFRDAVACRDQVISATRELEKSGSPLSCSHGPRNLIGELVDYYFA